MKTKLDILKWLTPILVLLATACGHDELLPDDVYVEETGPYVELRIAVPLANPTSTRANPMGGEEGNGREQGIENEDKIHDVNVFFYIEETDASGKGLGMDSKDDTKIIKHIYYNLDNANDPDNTKLVTGEIEDENPTDYQDKGYVTLRFECTQDEMTQAKNTGIDFVAIANVGPIQYTEGMTLKQLRDLRLGYKKEGTGSWSSTIDAYTADVSKMDYFIMSTAYNCYSGVENEGQKYGYNKIAPSGKNYSGSSTLQRLYARLDLWYNEEMNAVRAADNNNLIELKYSVVDKAGDIIKDATDETKDFAMVYVTNVLPVNVMQDPSYLFKKVTAVNASWNANSTIWNKANLSSITNFSWGGKESPDYPSSGNDFPQNYVMEWHTRYKEVGGASPADSLDAWYGKTARDKVIKNIDAKNADVNSDGHFSAYYDMQRSATGSDSYIYYDNDNKYPVNHVSVISYANENTHPTDCFHSNYLTGMAFRAVYVPGKIYKDYTDGNLVEMTLQERENFTVTDATYIHRYSLTDTEVNESESLYFSDYSALNNYKKDHPQDRALVTTFTAIHNPEGGELGFVCYYNLWLRHYNNEGADPQTSYPMEYATVRNNIYRVWISFTGPGEPTPMMREPDTMQARIFVRKWNYREEDTFYFD